MLGLNVCFSNREIGSINELDEISICLKSQQLYHFRLYFQLVYNQKILLGDLRTNNKFQK